MGAAQTQEWKPLAIGAGGWLTGLNIADDGTMVVRTDTYGAYIWNAATSQWDQLVTATRIGEPSYKFRDAVIMGCYEIALAPSDSDRIYMVWDGYIYRSDDKGASWTQTSFSRITALDPNDGNRTSGQKMAVDPADPDTCYFGAGTAGVWYTHDAGANWTQIPTGTIPFGTAPGHAGIAFDATSGVDGNGYTNVIMVPSRGNQVYRTANAGSTWAATSGGPTAVWKGHFQPGTGVYFCCDRTSAWKYASGSWTSMSSATAFESIAFKDGDVTKFIGFNDGAVMVGSFDNGATWNPNYWPPAGRAAADIPWLAWTEETYMSMGDVQVNPVDSLMYFSEGIGVWKAAFPAALENAVTWTSQSKGIEQLVANWIWSVPGGATLVTAWDRQVFRSTNPDTFPSVHGTNTAFAYGASAEHAVNDIDFVAVSSGWFTNESAYSTDGGVTWNDFPTLPSWANAPLGHIAVSTDQNMVWVSRLNQVGYYTLNRGTTWTALPSPVNVSTDWGQYNNRHIVCADRVTQNKFYLYIAAGAAIGLYVSTNGGADWSLAFSGHLVNTADGFNAKIKAVPGQAGHLFYTNGSFGGGDHVGPDSGELFKRSTDGGETWSTVSNVLEVYDFGFGKEKPGESYPTIFIAGFVNSVFGIWMSDDNCSTWTRLGNTVWPNDSVDIVKAVGGDMNVYGRCYVGFQGSGFAYWG